MNYQGTLVNIAKDYVVLATSQSQSLMCGGQMSCNTQLTKGWAPIEPQIDWYRSTARSAPQQAPPSVIPERHYVSESIFAEEETILSDPPPLPQRNVSLDEPPKTAEPAGDKDIGQLQPAVAEKANAKEASAKGKKYFKLFRIVKNVMKRRFR